MSKNKFEYAEKDTLPEVIEDKDVTVQISLKIEGDLLKDIRAKANEAGLPYQTYLKQVLRQHLSSQSDAGANRMDRLEQEVMQLRNTLAQFVRRHESSKSKWPSKHVVHHAGGKTKKRA